MFTARDTCLVAMVLGAFLAIPLHGAPAVKKNKPATTKPAPTSAPAPPVDTNVVVLAEPFHEYHPAAGGRVLVFHERKARQLALYEATTGKPAGTIALGSDSISFACDEDCIIVALPDEKILQRYDLKTCQRVKSAPMPDERPFRRMVMGNASTGPLFMYFGGEIVPVDPATLEPIKHTGALSHDDAFCVSADGSTLVCWNPHAEPSSISIQHLRDGNASSTSHGAFSMANRRFTPTADGAMILYETKFFDSRGQDLPSTLQGFRNSLSTSDPRFFLLVKDTEKHHSAAAICAVSGRKILAHIDDLPELDNAGWDAGGCGLVREADSAEPRLVYLPEDNILVAIATSNDRFEFLKADLNAAMAGGAGGVCVAAEPLAVISLPVTQIAANKDYAYQLQVLPSTAGMKYKVEAGPQGLSISAGGLVTWPKAAPAAAGKVNVILSITDAAGHEVAHAFAIDVVPAPTVPVVATATPPKDQPHPSRPVTPATQNSGPKIADGGIPKPAATQNSVPKIADGAIPKPAPHVAEIPPTTQIVKVDDNRIELPPTDCRYTFGLDGKVLLLSGDQLAILAADGFTIQKTLTLPKRYTAIAERRGYYIALAENPHAVDMIDKQTLKVTKSKTVPFNKLIDLVAHPTKPIVFISYIQPGEVLQHQFLIFDETTGEAHTDKNWLGEWLAMAPGGEFLMAGWQDTYQKGHDIIDNPDRIWIVPTFGSHDTLCRYDLDPDSGLPRRVASRDDVGGNGSGIRLSPDGKRATYLSFVGYPSMSHNLGAWDPLDLGKLPVSYDLKDSAGTKDLAFHPLLPLVACFGKSNVVFFNRESGAKQDSRVNGGALENQEIDRVYFSPDGLWLLVETGTHERHFLTRLALKLTAEEKKAAGSLPRPDKPMNAAPLPPPPEGGQKLPTVKA